MSASFSFSACYLTCCGLLLLCSCQRAGADGPGAVPIEGKVVFVRGGDAAELNGSQAMIELQSVERPDVVAIGQVHEDGTFHVTTLEDGIVREGAIEGTHRVRLNLDESAEHLVAPQFLRFNTSQLTIKVPNTEPIEVKVWR